MTKHETRAKATEDFNTIYDSGDVVVLPGDVMAIVVGYDDEGMMVCNISGTTTPVLTTEDDVLYSLR